MITISEVDKTTGLVTGVNCLSSDTLGSDIDGTGVSNGAIAVFIDGGAAIYDKENDQWIVQ